MELFKVVEGDFDVATGRLRFTQEYVVDGARTRWEARVVGYPHGPPGPSSLAPSPSVAAPKMVEGSWSGDCDGCFSATLLYTLTLNEPLEQKLDTDGSQREASAMGHGDVARSEDFANGRSVHSRFAAGSGREAAEQAAAQSLRMEHEQQQQSAKAESAAESFGVVGASFDKLRAKFFRACVQEAQHAEAQARKQRALGRHSTEWLSVMQAAEAGRLTPQSAFDLGSELGLILQTGSDEADHALLELQAHGQRHGVQLVDFVRWWGEHGQIHTAEL